MILSQWFELPACYCVLSFHPNISKKWSIWFAYIFTLHYIKNLFKGTRLLLFNLIAIGGEVFVNIY